MNKELGKGVLLSAIALSMLLGACRKEQPMDVGSSSQLSPQQRIALIDARVGYHGYSGDQRWLNAGWRHFLMADVGGAVTGFKLANRYGWMTGEPELADACGIVFGGVIGSGYQYWDAHNSMILSDTMDLDLNPAVLSFASTYSDSSEMLGYYHNVNMMRTFKKGNQIDTSLDGFVNEYGPIYARMLSSAYGVDSTYLIACVADTTFRSQLLLGDITLSELLSSMDRLVPDASVEAYHDSLYTRIFSLKEEEVTEAIDYFNAYTDLLKDDNKISAENKRFLNGEFAIGKYSTALWAENQQ